MATCSTDQLERFMKTYDRKIKRLLELPTGTKLSWEYSAQGGRTGEGLWTLRCYAHTHEPIAQFTIQQMLGCCGVCISTAARVYAPYTKRGLGTLLNEMRLGMAKRLGYGVMMCTDVSTSLGTKKILAANGWTTVWQFRNPRTGRTVIMSIRDLADIDCSDVPNVAASWPAELAEAAR